MASRSNRSANHKTLRLNKVKPNWTQVVRVRDRLKGVTYWNNTGVSLQGASSRMQEEDVVVLSEQGAG